MKLLSSISCIGLNHGLQSAGRPNRPMKTYSGNVVQLALVLAALVINFSVIQPAKAFISTTTGSLNTARWNHTATLLNNGKVLVVGGSGISGVLQDAELYDPATGTWTPTSSPNTARWGHTATLLPNGKVLVAGGTDGSSSLSSTELYDPATGTWTVTGSLNTARFGQTATLLQNGKVLVAGGFNSASSDLALRMGELYDPATGYWTVSKGNRLITSRYEHTATLLPDGRVLVAGGYNTSSGVLSSAELYTPSDNGGSWLAASDMGSPRNSHTATLLPNGNVLIAGGFYGTFLSSSEFYTPDSGAGTWTSTGLLNEPRCANTATLLPNGAVLVTGGEGPLSSVELYKSFNGGGTWMTDGSLLNARDSHTATLLANGQVLIVGGYEDGIGPLSSAELCDSASPAWMNVGTLNQMRGGQTATLLPDGTVLAAGGIGPTGWLPNAEVYDPATWTWTVTNPLHTARCDHTATLLANGRVLVVGGTNANGYLPTHYGVEQYNPVTGTWTVPPASCTLCHNPPPPAALDSRPTGHLHIERCLHTATLLSNGKVLIAGGVATNDVFNITELFDPVTGFWSLWPVESRSCTSCHTVPPSDASDKPAGHLHTPRYGHTATLMPDGTVLVAGGKNANGYLMNGQPNEQPGQGPGPDLEVGVEQYDPVAGTWAPPKNCEDCHTQGWPESGPFGHLGRNGRSGHTATLLPNGQVLVAGGELDGISLSSSMLYDPVNRWWSYTTSIPTGDQTYMATARYGHKATLLPNGKVLVTGGLLCTSSGGSISAVNSAELYDPASGTWTTTSPLITARAMHTAALLPDGEVMVAGGFDSLGVPLASSEIYNVGLGFSPSWQPQLDPFGSELGLGGNLTLSGSGFRGVSEGSCGNSQDSPGNVPVVQLLSLGNEQTLFLLPDPDTGWSDTAYTSGRVSGFPPGYALVTVFVNGIPSVSSDPPDIPGTENILDISVPVPTPPTLTGPQKLADGSFQFAFTNSIGALFGVLTSTNLALPMTNWTVLGGVTEISLGQFQFADLQLTNDAQRFYRVYSP